MFLSSDLPALLPHTRRVVFLTDGDVAAVTSRRRHLLDSGRRPRSSARLRLSPLTRWPRPRAATSTSCSRRSWSSRRPSSTPSAGGRASSRSGLDLEDDALHRRPAAHPAGRPHRDGHEPARRDGRQALHRADRRHSRRRWTTPRSSATGRPLSDPETLVISVAQSGETVDTLEAMAEAKRRGALQITVCNTPGSQATRIADGVVYTRCGLEIGVASTKTLLGSIVALYLLACYLGQRAGPPGRATSGGAAAPPGAHASARGQRRRQGAASTRSWPTRSSVTRTSSTWRGASSTR